jgi:glycosyltransferase involved in cell wall biosynthesis
LSIDSVNGTSSLALPPGKVLLMLATSEKTLGGIAAVVKTHRAGGLFGRVSIRHVATHIDGTRLAKGMRFVGSLAETLSLLLSRRVAAVHAHVSSSASFWRKSTLLLLCRCFGVPSIFHLHSGRFAEWVEKGRGGAARRWWIRNTLESSDVVVVLTPTWADWIKKFAPRAHVEVLSNPVSVPTTALLPADRASASGPGRVLYLGWIYDFKGCYDLLRSWALFRSQCPGWRLAVGGKGEVDRFLAEAERLGVRDDIDFLGWVSGDAKDRELRRADIFVLPSYSEGMPVSVLEAMAYGVAVITTPVGGVPDMMEPDVHGLWVQPGDIQGMCDRLVQLAESPPLRAKLAEAARRRVVQDSSVEAVIEALLKIYARLLRKPAA